jgi:hypothetical protein
MGESDSQRLRRNVAAELRTVEMNPPQCKLPFALRVDGAIWTAIPAALVIRSAFGRRVGIARCLRQLSESIPPGFEASTQSVPA